MAMTTREGDRWYVIGSDGRKLPWEQVPNELYGALCKLRDYERLGLDPDGVERLIEDNKRLKNLLDEMQAIIEG